jgi:hypothetical protein
MKTSIVQNADDISTLPENLCKDTSTRTSSARDTTPASSTAFIFSRPVLLLIWPLTPALEFELFTLSETDFPAKIPFFRFGI